MAAVTHHRNKPDEPAMHTDSALSSRQSSTAKFLTAGAIGTTLLIMSGLTLTGTVMALIMATPVVVVFSPILVPAGIVMFLAATGLVFSGGCGVAAVTALSWLYRYVSNYVAAKKRAHAYGQFIMLGV